MGRRSRKRSGSEVRDGAPEQSPAPAPKSPPRPLAAPPRRRASIDERPPAPWDPFPLVELSILVGMVLIVVGFVGGGEGRPILIFGGLGLITLASLELTVREHFNGYRSHTLLLAGVVALLVAVPLWFSPLPQEAILLIAIATGVAAGAVLRRVFASKTGGLTWRS